MAYNVAALRAHFPALEEGAAHFDGPGGSQVPDSVAAAVAATLTSAVANRGQLTRAERRAEAIVVSARAAAADLVGGQAEGIVFGRSMTALTYDMSRAMAKRWGPGDEVVVTRLDHDANIRPWVQAAAAAQAGVRWADFEPASGELPLEAVTSLLSERTRLVAVTAASNLVGTRPDVASIVAAAHRVGALVYVDGVHLSAHAPVDTMQLGADFYACSPYKWMGPHCGLVAADPGLLQELHPDKLVPSTDAVPERFELGTLPYELLAGVSAAVDFIAGICGTAGTRRARILSSMAAVEAHEARLRTRLEEHLDAMAGVVRHSRATRRTPTLLLSFPGRDPAQVSARLAERGVNAPAGSFYAIEASRRLGLGDSGGLRVGVAPYTNEDDIDRLVAVLDDVVADA